MDNATVDFGMVQDVHNLDKLRRLSSKNSSIADKTKALVTAAQQFESLLNQFWVKEMRATNDSICGDSPLKSKESEIFQSMLDEQMISSISAKNSNNNSSITNLLVKQFARSMGDEGKEILSYYEGNKNSASSSNINRALESYRSNSTKTEYTTTTNYSNTNDNVSEFIFNSPKDFVDKIMPIAKKVASSNGFNPLVIVCQAALETGWGKHIGAKNNLFGIKANEGDDKSSLLTTEYVNGKRIEQIDSFKNYSSLENSIKDYVSLIKNSDRYAKAFQKNNDPDQYFEEIQKANYATDPNYAGKLKRILHNDVFSSYL
ncbi:MAG: flagellar assembly peptidoglycan hydrolase FlgJ [Succinivibrionaceae bacterium]